MAMAIEEGLLKAGDRVAMLGFGSGLSSMMVGVQWEQETEGRVTDTTT